MGQYDTQQVCENGHQVTSSYHEHPELRRDFCESCGARTLCTCSKCGTEIRGHFHVPNVLSLVSTSVPEFCQSCGHSFPWAGKKAAATAGKMSFGTPEQTLQTVFDRFHLTVRQLRHRHDGRPTLDVQNEYDVQELLHAILRIFFDDIRPEEWTPSYAGGSSRMDFLLKDVQTVIEVKKSRKGLTAKLLGDELLVDISRYKAHPDWKKLVCFVYDPEGQIANPRALENDLSKAGQDIEVRVYIRPA
jgi:hypothetical protein